MKKDVMSRICLFIQTVKSNQPVLYWFLAGYNYQEDAERNLNCNLVYYYCFKDKKIFHKKQ